MLKTWMLSKSFNFNRLYSKEKNEFNKIQKRKEGKQPYVKVKDQSISD